jgi:hypothetical protein
MWLWRHAWVLVGVGRGVGGYLDGWAVDVEHGFGLVALEEQPPGLSID